MKEKIKCSKCGKMAKRDIVAEQQGVTPGNRARLWPMTSVAAGCTPQNIKRQVEALAKKGLKCEFTRDGRAIFTGPKHRKQICEAMGLADNNGGYSDPRHLGRINDECDLSDLCV